MRFIRKKTLTIYSAYSIFRLAEASAIAALKEREHGTLGRQADDPTRLKYDAFQTLLDMVVEKVRDDLFGEDAEMILRQIRGKFKEKQHGEEKDQEHGPKGHKEESSEKEKDREEAKPYGGGY